MILLEKQTKGLLTQVLYAQSSMNQQIKALDQAAEMSVYLCGLIRFGRNITIPPHQIIQHKGYTQGFVIVARLKKEKKLVGKVSVGIKQVNLFGKAEKLGYIFDMRIDIQYQRSGMGRLLFQAIQLECNAAKCTGYICSVNSNNVKSLNFFTKTQGFNIASQRKIYSATSIKSQFTNKKELDIPDNQKIHIQFFDKNNNNNSNNIILDPKNVDYCPLKIDQIRNCKGYLGMLKVNTTNSSAQIHTYLGDKSFGMVPQRFFLTMQNWQKWYYRLLVFIFLMLLPFGLILGSLDFKQIPASINNSVMFWIGIALIILSIALQLGFYYLLNILNSDFVRIFGYQFKGKQQERKKLTKIMLEQIQKYAYSIGASSVRLNEDLRAVYVEAINDKLTSFGKRASTIFLYKLKNGQRKIFSENNFFDPRDL